ncbi:MAG: efflux RND transporter periplasmic adaptor subunit [Bacteroidaceae bacterium]|nr:efflux RND transporter periplasmic adaptor subunit [Bacteroidaceae bacterium]
MKTNTYLIALFGVLLSGCGKKETSARMEALPVEVAKPLVKNVTLTRDYPGYLTAETSVDIVGRVNGTLLSKLYPSGQRVKKGQTLFVVDPTLYQNAVKQAEAALKTAKANLDYARSNYERMKEAIKSDAVSRIQLAQAESNVQIYEAAVSNAEAELKTARVNLSYCYIKSPIDGIADLAEYSDGAYISGEGNPVKMTTVYQDSKLYSYFDISDNQYLAFELLRAADTKIPEADHSVTLRVGADGSKTWQGKLNYLSPSFSLSTGTMRLRAELENPDGVLKPGLYVSVTLPYATAEKAILVDNASIGTDQLGKFLYVVNDSNVVNTRHVELGQLVDDGMRIVTSGLSPDERYVTKALMKVRQGMKIQPIQK